MTPSLSDIPDTPTFPVQFGKYELLERIAVGGMAEIFRARSASLGGLTRICVIKRILPEFSASRQFVSMFIDEARITIGLDDDNIVRLFDFGQVDGTYFMAMEFVDGADLVDVLRHHKKAGAQIDPLAAAYVARCMCDGLYHAHTQEDHRGMALGVVHRDVSPHNVFLSWEGAVKIGDFGIASARNKLTVTQAGTVKGKFAYMSPEQTTGGMVDARADIWATGVVLWEMLTGERLFASDNPVVTIGRVCEMIVQAPSITRPGLPAALDAVALRALDRHLPSRYKSAAEMSADLSVILDAASYDQSCFSDFLISLEWADNTLSDRMKGIKDLSQDRVERVISSATDDDDDTIRDLIARMYASPDLWTLVAIGERLQEIDRPQKAISAFRTAAALFASRGLLVQALCVAHKAGGLLKAAQSEVDYESLSQIQQDPMLLLGHMQLVDQHGFHALVKDAQAAYFGDQADDNTAVLHSAPLLGRLQPQVFSRLAQTARIEHFGVGDLIVQEGERGDALFAVGRGRLIVHTLPGDSEKLIGDGSGEGGPIAPSVLPPDHINLSALADGDFFGEFSFLTKRPRSASVEAITECTIVIIDRTACDDLILSDPSFKEPLLQFYKERVGELMMAKNPVFALLEAQDRRELLDKSNLVRFSDEEIILHQGDVSDQMYFIKHGEVEIYAEESGIPVFINKLREGEFFGEIAAINQTARSANVRAMGDVELFCMTGGALDQVLAKDDRVRQLFDAAIAWRTAETSARKAESRRIFEGI